MDELGLPGRAPGTRNLMLQSRHSLHFSFALTPAKAQSLFYHDTLQVVSNELISQRSPRQSLILIACQFSSNVDRYPFQFIFWPCVLMMSPVLLLRHMISFLSSLMFPASCDQEIARKRKQCFLNNQLL